MRPLLLSTIAASSLLLAAPESANAQFYRPWRPWFRPPVVVVRPPVVPVYVPPPVYAPPVYVQPPVYAPPVYMQPPVYQPPPVYMQPAPPPPVYVQPAPAPIPAPPVYAAPPPPVYAAPPPPPVYAAPPPPPPVYAAPPPPPVYMAPPATFRTAPVLKSQFPTRFGIGGRFAGTINTDQFTEFSQLGFGGELLFRSHRRLVLELAGEYQKRVDDGFSRYDIPVTLGLRVHIGAPDWVLSPYFVFAGGVAYSNLDFLHSQDTAWFLDGQLGGGLELRLGKHFAITGDIRGDFRHRITQPSAAAAATTSINGKPFAPMQDQYGVQFRLGAAVYF